MLSYFITQLVYYLALAHLLKICSSIFSYIRCFEDLKTSDMWRNKPQKHIYWPHILPMTFSEDLRWRVIWLYEIYGKEVHEISDLLSISRTSILRWLECFQLSGLKPPFVRTRHHVLAVHR